MVNEKRLSAIVAAVEQKRSVSVADADFISSVIITDMLPDDAYLKYSNWEAAKK